MNGGCSGAIFHGWVKGVAWMVSQETIPKEISIYELSLELVILSPPTTILFKKCKCGSFENDLICKFVFIFSKCF